MPEDAATRRVALMRYADQGYELPIPWPADGASRPPAAVFAAAHRTLYGFDLPEVAVGDRHAAPGGRRPLPAAAPVALPSAGAASPIGQQPLHLKDGTRDAALYERHALGAGTVLDGPAILLQLDATTVVPPGWQARVDASGALLLAKLD